jgi:hypothetical protein
MRANETCRTEVLDADLFDSLTQIRQITGPRPDEVELMKARDRIARLPDGRWAQLNRAILCREHAKSPLNAKD